MSGPPLVDYERFCNASLALLCTASPDGYFLWVNPAFEQTLGYSAAELRAIPSLKLVHPEDRAATVQTAALRASGLPVTSFDNRYRCADGSYKWLSWSATQDAQGIVYASARDITAEKEMQADLSRLARIAASTTNGVIVTDLAARIEWVNESFTRISGYSFAESMGRKPGDFLQGPETNPAAVAHMRACLASHRGFNVEVLNYTKTGRSYWISIEVQPLSDSQGCITGYMAIQLDISARKLAEQRIQENARLLTRMSELSKVGGWQVDLQRMVPLWTEQVYRIHEIEDDFELDLQAAINFYHPSARPEVEALVARAIETGEGWDREWP
ncbi:MAG: PAS domain S-box protein, partial [Acidobacteria bacterium]|nr:PAS domain S-box protein [Acidobacteriota bacterium]